MTYLLVFLISFIVSYLLIPRIISYSLKRNLVDTPDHRKVHKTLIPALGGVAVFITVLLTFAFQYQNVTTQSMCILLSSSMIVGIGIIDDIKPQKALFKLLIQILATFAVVYYGAFYIQTLSGTFGIFEIEKNISILFSVFIIITFINALNLIDGINGLAASLGIIYFIFFFYFYFHTHHLLFAFICLAFIGSLLAFLRYNLISPSIFLGDTGSTLIGFISALFLIDFLNISNSERVSMGILNPYGILLCLFSIPLFDTFRVAAIRILKQKSPFSPDKTHIHHLFLRLDFRHYHITGILVLCNILLIISAFLLQEILGDTLTISTLLGLFVFGFFILEFFITKKFKMRYNDDLTVDKFRQFIAEYWYLFFSVIVFVIPFQRWATSIPIIIYSIFWLFSLDTSKLDVKRTSLYYLLTPSCIFILAILYYSIISFHMESLLLHGMRYLPFFLFPLFLFLKKEYFSLEKWYSILAFYVIGVLTFSGILLGITLLRKLSGLATDIYIPADHIISNIPQIYLSLLINFAVMSILYLKKSSIHILKKPIISFVLIIFLGVIMLLIHSKIGFVAMIGILLIGGIIQWMQYKKIQPASIAFLCFFIYASIQFYSPEKMHFNYLYHSSEEVTKRWNQWSKSIALIQESPIIGWGQNYLSALNPTATTSLNAHNQYFELWIEYGIGGIFMIGLLFLFSFYIAARSKDFFFLGFLGLISLYCVFESLFTNQTGIVFFSIFNTLFLLKSRLRIKT